MPTHQRIELIISFIEAVKAVRIWYSLVMSFPNTAGKHSFDPFFTPQELIEFEKKNGVNFGFSIPKGVIFVYHNSLLKYIEKTEKLIPVENVFAGKFYLHEGLNSMVGISGGFGIGAPAVTTVMEELIAFGVKNFISIGTAGGLQKSLNIGDVVICDKAIRDEGVSHHYLEAGKYSITSKELTTSFKNQLDKNNLNPIIGSTWTIDAPYRETVEELKNYQKEGVLTVEMEASALAAVAQFRNVNFATGYIVSDSLADLVWNPQFSASNVKENLQKVYHSAVETILSI